jgi:2'-5' RNA ligase
VVRDLFDEIHEAHVKAKNPMHPSGKITGYEEKSGLPIVKLDSHPSTEPKQEKTADGERDILHASTDRNHLVQEGKEKARELKSHLKAVTDAVPGAHKPEVRAEKDPDRLNEKIHKEGQPVETIPDVLAGRIPVDSPEAHKEVVDKIKQTAPVVRDEDKFKKGDSKFGYRAHKLQVGVSPDMSAEVHVVPKEVADAGDDSHKDYKKGREAELDGDKETADTMAAKAKEKNDAAMSKFNERNRTKVDDKRESTGQDRGKEPPGSSGGKTPERSSSSEKQQGKADSGGLKVGDKVTLPNGKLATVAYVPAKSAQLPTYRFKLAGGGAVELRARDVEGKVKPEPKYKFGNTQINLDPASDAHKAIKGMQAKIQKEHRSDVHEDQDNPHVTVRYGVKDGDTSKLKDYISQQAPFEAKLGKTMAFPVSEHSEGAAPIVAHVESSDLHRINGEIEKHGDFAPSSFPDYKPHATVAYVKPEHAKRYSGMADGEGKTFNVKSIHVGDREGNTEEVPLKGGKAPDNVPRGTTINVDLDSTLAHSDSGGSRMHIGAPQPEMVDRIKKDLAAGKQVKIFTARVANDPDGKVREAIQRWSKQHLGVALEVTDKKQEDTGEILDDKAKHVEPNKGKVEG